MVPTRLSYRINDATADTGLPRSRIYVLINEGKLEVVKDGRRTLIIGDSLRRYIESLRKQPAAQSQIAA